MSEWGKVRLGDYTLKIGSGATPRGGQESYKKSGIALIRSQNVYNNYFSYDGLAFIDNTQAELLKNVEIETNDILLNITGDSVARVCQVPSTILPARVNQHVMIIRPNPKEIDPTFLRYYLVSADAQSTLISLASSGATRQALTKGMIENLEIPKPILKEQKRIAHILGALDDKIEANRQMNAILEATARAIFQSWFVNFDPVHAKARGEMPYGMDAETADLFPDDFVESELGMIPRGWEIGVLGDDFNIVMGQSPPSETYNTLGEGLPFYQGSSDFEFRYPKVRVFCTSPTRKAHAGDSLVSVRAPVGDLNMALVDCSIGRGVASIRHKLDNRSYTYYTMSFLGEQFARYDADGTVFGSINKTTFNNLRVILPPKEIIHQFENVAYSIDEQIKVNEEQIRTLTETRDSLLPKLISGEIQLEGLT